MQTKTRNIYLGDTLIGTIDGSTVTYPLVDHLGSVEKVTNAGGTLIEITDYYPFGKERTHTGTNTKRRYIGEQYDASTELNYLNARYYDGERGQFLSQDSMFQSPENFLTDPQQFNSYSYARGNPLRWKDPKGESIIEALLIKSALNNYINNAANVSSNVRTVNFASQHPLVALRVGVAVDGSDKNLTSISSNFAVNLRSNKSEGNDGTERNAIRHAIWQSILTKQFNAPMAEKIGNAHEQTPFIDLSNRTFNSLSQADQTADLLNNKIGRNIGITNQDLSNNGLAQKVLDTFYQSGLYTVSNINNQFIVNQTKLSPEQYKKDLSNLSTLKNNGLTK